MFLDAALASIAFRALNLSDSVSFLGVSQYLFAVLKPHKEDLLTSWPN